MKEKILASIKRLNIEEYTLNITSYKSAQMFFIKKSLDTKRYNILKFDLPILVEEFLRVDYDFDLKDRNFIDVMNIYMKMEPRTLKGAYRFFCHAELEGACLCLRRKRSLVVVHVLAFWAILRAWSEIRS